MKDKDQKFISNPELKTTKFPDGWKGTPLDLQGRFMNLHHPYTANFKDVLKWKSKKNPYGIEKKEEKWMPKVFKNDQWLTEVDDVIVWLGHSTFFIRINGIQLLTDPVFWNVFPIKRQSELPIDVKRFTNLDYILLSHDHRDHLDKKSLDLLAKQNPKATYLTGLGMKKLVHGFAKSTFIQEAGWYQQYNTEKITVHFIPSRHWSKRGLTDTNQRLWGGFVIEASGKRILFGGDSGYDTHYSQLASVFEHFNYAILGIGAYEPSWFMSPNHQSPSEALKGFKELNAGYLIPMHYGTFDLSDEPMGQPLKDLYRAAAGKEEEKKLRIVEIGQKIII